MVKTPVRVVFPFAALMLIVQLAWGNELLESVFRFQMSLAEQGNVDAQIKVGEMYEEGRGVEQDHAKALEWYGLAVKGADPAVQEQIKLRIERVGQHPEVSPQPAVPAEQTEREQQQSEQEAADASARAEADARARAEADARAREEMEAKLEQERRRREEMEKELKRLKAEKAQREQREAEARAEEIEKAKEEAERKAAKERAAAAIKELEEEPLGLE